MWKIKILEVIFMKKLLALLMALAMVFALVACGEKAEETNTLTMATNAEFPPFEYLEGNEIVGADVDIALAIAEKLGKTLYINDMEFDALDLIELTMELEHHYNITIDEIEFDNLFVVADIVQLVYNKTK